MPRSARIDIPGLLHHVIVRGIERSDIFLDDDDRRSFLERFSKLLIASETDCLAWALMTNHFHLLLRPRSAKLSHFMRRLLTGYAVVFNLRHHRSGHLFQNRYKSVVCDEDSYLLELVRYIHLNPLRVGLAGSIEALDLYKWSGHAVLMGNEALSGQNTDEVLLMFGNRKKNAREKYRNFVADGIPLGKRDELGGGGLRRYLKISGTNDLELFDERILGSGDFVQRLLQEDESTTSATVAVSLDEILQHVAATFSIEASALVGGSKIKQFADARGAVCYIAARKVGINGAVIAKRLNISRAGVVLAARRGEAIVKRIPELQIRYSCS